MRHMLGSMVLLLACSDDPTTVPDASARDGSTSTDAGRDASTAADAADDAREEPDSTVGTDAGADAGTDAGADPGAGCEGSAALFCEDFEALAEGTASSDDWDTQVGSGSLTVDGEHARGARSLHVHSVGNSWAFLVLPFEPPGNSYFGRMYLYVEEFPSAPDWAHYTLVEATGDGAGQIRPVGGQFVPDCCGGPGAFWGIGSDGGPTGDWTNWRTSAPSEAGRWVCVEWQIDASDNFIRLSFDGADNEELTVSTRDHGGSGADFVFPQFDELKIGWQLYQPNPTPGEFDLWIDDIVLATTRVGCD